MWGPAVDPTIVVRGLAIRVRVLESKRGRVCKSLPPEDKPENFSFHMTMVCMVCQFESSLCQLLAVSELVSASGAILKGKGNLPSILSLDTLSGEKIVRAAVRIVLAHRVPSMAVRSRKYSRHLSDCA